MKTIYNTYIEVTSQEQADRLKQMCINNNLPIWDSFIGFLWNGDETFCYCNEAKEFFLFNHIDYNDTNNNIKVTEKQFLKLLQDERIRNSISQ